MSLWSTDIINYSNIFFIIVISWLHSESHYKLYEYSIYSLSSTISTDSYWNSTMDTINCYNDISFPIEYWFGTSIPTTSGMIYSVIDKNGSTTVDGSSHNNIDSYYDWPHCSTQTVCNRIY